MNRKTIIVVGAGKLGSSIAKKLYSEGENVTVIDRNPDSVSNLEGYGGFYEKADATDLDVLRANGIEEAKAIILTTNDDNTNIFLCNVAQQIFHLEHIFVRLADSRKGKLCEGDNVKLICPFTLSLDDFENSYKEVR